MNTSQAIANAANPHDPRSLRSECGIIALFFTALFLLQLRYPPLSYPHIGLLQIPVLALIGILLPLKLYKTCALSWTPAFLPAALLILYALIRWAMVNFSTRGLEEIGTLLWAACYFSAAYCLTTCSLRPDTNPVNRRPALSFSLGNMLLVTLCLLGLVCGVHAWWQYHISYSDTYHQLLSSLKGRPPDRTELALLYHLKLRRVAGFFGDPNSLATFAAITLCCSIELLSRPKWLLRLIAAISAVGAVTAVYYSGSRGGALDVVLVFSLYVLAWIGTRRKSVLKVATPIAALLLALTLAPAGQAQSSAATAVTAAPDAWQWRSTTIRERLFYIDVGQEMIRMAPSIGLGPGSVEQYFGRLKDPQARETRYLHNWVVHIWAELGAVGLALVCWFLYYVIASLRTNRFLTNPAVRPFGIIVILFTFDGLIQVSWSQRELLCTFATACGIIVATRPIADMFTARKSSPVAPLAIALFVVSIWATVETFALKAKSTKQLAEDATFAGDLSAAMKNWTLASQWWPNDPEPYAARAALALETGQLSSARLLLKKALEMQPDSASLNSQLAGIEWDLGDKRQADNLLTKALALYPSHPEYHYKLAQFMAADGRTTEARALANKAVKFAYIESDLPRYESLAETLNTSETIPK